MRVSLRCLATSLLFASTLAMAQEPPPAIPAGPPPVASEGPLAIPAPGQPGAPPAPPTAFAQPDKGYPEGLADGRMAAENKNAGEWFAIGVGSGCLLNWLGCSVATVATVVVDPTLPQPYAADFYKSTDIERDYWNGFRTGYTKQMKQKRAVRVFAGGAVGSAVVLGAYIGLIGVAGSNISY